MIKVSQFILPLFIYLFVGNVMKRFDDVRVFRKKKGKYLNFKIWDRLCCKL